MRAKEEKDVRPRLEPRMSPRATEGCTEGRSEDIIGRWPWSGGSAGLAMGAWWFSRRGTWEVDVRLNRAVRTMRGFMVVI